MYTHDDRIVATLDAGGIDLASGAIIDFCETKP